MKDLLKNYMELRRKPKHSYFWCFNFITVACIQQRIKFKKKKNHLYQAFRGLIEVIHAVCMLKLLTDFAESTMHQ